jgi:short-subunit dehydrogenase
VLVNNAGIMPVGPLLDESDETARRMFDVNVHGVLIGMKLAVPLIAHRPGARIVNIASYAGKLAVPGEVTYAGTKAAVIAISAGARWELEPKGIGVTTVMPTFTNTELIAGTAPVKTVVPIEPDHVALAIVDSITNARDEVYVPKSLKPVGNAFNLLPRRLRQRLYHRMGLDQAFIQVDSDKRRVYSERIKALR